MSCYLCTPKHINYLVPQVENLTSRRDNASFWHDAGRVYIQRGFDSTPYSAQSVTLQGLVEALRTAEHGKRQLPLRRAGRPHQVFCLPATVPKRG